MIIWVTVVLGSGLGAPVVSVTTGRAAGSGLVALGGGLGAVLLGAMVFVAKFQQLSWEANAYTIFSSQLAVICAMTLATGLVMMYDTGFSSAPEPQLMLLPVIVNGLACVVYFPVMAGWLSMASYDDVFYQQLGIQSMTSDNRHEMISDGYYAATFGWPAIILAVVSTALAGAVTWAVIRVLVAIKTSGRASGHRGLPGGATGA